MAFDVKVNLKRKFEAPCSIDKVFEVLSDVPYSVSHFPKVEELSEIDDNTFKWEMEKIGIDKYYLQTVYACEYTSNEAEGWVKWEPVEGVGNGLVEGGWELSEKDGTTEISFKTKGVMSINLSRLVKMVVSPFAIREFETLIDQYIDNLQETFSDL